MPIPLSNADLRQFIDGKVQTYYQNRKRKIGSLSLKTVIAKNPYLYRVKNFDTADQYVKSVIDALLSSGEETSFGNFLEELAIYVCGLVYGGRKSGAKGIDLEVDKDGIRYAVAIKSGPNWANDSQIAKMVQDFVAYRRITSTSGSRLHVEFINGCCYGQESRPDRPQGYTKLCGQDFWTFISGDSMLYRDLIEPLGLSAEEPSQDFQSLYSQAVNRITRDFLNEYCDSSGEIDWDRIVVANSSSLNT